MAMGVRLALYRRGIRVPDDISLVGFDDQPTSAFMTPPLTTVKPSATELGRAAALSISSVLKDASFELPQASYELVVRESVARLR